MKVRSFIFALTLCLLPAIALAVIEPSQGVIRTGSTLTLTAENKAYTIRGSESGVSIVVESGVEYITLDSASITAPQEQDALTANGSLTLELMGTNSITGGSSYTIAGRGVVLPPDAALTIGGSGDLIVYGGTSLYDNDHVVSSGKGAAAITGSVVVKDDAQVRAAGGNALGGFWNKSESVTGGNGVEGSAVVNGGSLTATGGLAAGADYKNIAGHGVTGNAEVNGGKLTASGGAAKDGRRNYGGDGIQGSAKVNGGELTAAGGAASESDDTALIICRGGHGVLGDAEVNGGSLSATGGQAVGGQFTTTTSSEVNAGHGVNGSAVVHGGRLIAAGNSAFSPKDTFYISGGSGINGSVTAAGGYILATGGESSSDQKGKAAASENSSVVLIGSNGKRLAASVGEGAEPDKPLLKDGEYYTAQTDVTQEVSAMRSLETREFFAVSYACGWNGCDDSHEEYADGSAAYTLKTPESLGFDLHGLAFSGWTDGESLVDDVLTVAGPLDLRAVWKTVFTFEAGEGGTGSMPPLDVVLSGVTVRLPECGFSASAGYYFAGWKIGDDDTLYAAGEEVPAAGLIALTAVWEPLPALPDTGDDAATMLWALLCLGSCGLLLLLCARAER